MIRENKKRPLSEYVDAFANYIPWANQVFDTRTFGRHALVHDGSYVYQVSHFDDIMADYALLFSAEPEMIYRKFPRSLWAVFLKEKLNLTPENHVIDLYTAWQSFWEKQVNGFLNNEFYKSAKKIFLPAFQPACRHHRRRPGPGSRNGDSAR